MKRLKQSGIRTVVWKQKIEMIYEKSFLYFHLLKKKKKAHYIKVNAQV